jgi:short-subunit dehydrogenase
VVHPGGVATNIARNSRTGTGITDNKLRSDSIERFENAARTSPEAAARRIIDGIENNAARILVGFDARIIDLVQRLRPATYWAWLSRLFQQRTGAGKKADA